MSKQREVEILEFLRIVMGFIFLWTFVDKTFGLGFSTAAGKSWLSGSSPTEGFLKFGSEGPLATTFQNLAGSTVIDWLFMLGMLGVGLALIFGIGMKIASYSGSLIMFLIYLATIPPEHNPIFDDHVVYILLLIYLKDKAGFKWGFREFWSKTSLVRRNRFLE
jgi:thiosulfate dehydrogenase [quinone] large subunit